jgi:1-phosphofructokinase family hexose kinase
MIVTFTPNPAVDQTLFVTGLKFGEVNRARESELSPAGKGINVSRVAHRLGWPTMAFGFLAGDIGDVAQNALDAEGVQSHFARVPGQTRINVSIADEASGACTSVSCPGPTVTAEHLAELEGMLRFWLQATKVLVLAGSLPAGVPDDTYARIIDTASRQGVCTVLDADGEPLRLGVEATPYLIKPNRAEAERLLGRPLPDLEAVADGARELSARGIGVVVISMGADGAVCVEGGRARRAVSPKVEVRSTVGSGDSLVAGLCVGIARGDGIVEGLRLGTAAGAATAMTPGTELGSAEEIAALVAQVQVEDLG